MADLKLAVRIPKISWHILKTKNTAPCQSRLEIIMFAFHTYCPIAWSLDEKCGVPDPISVRVIFIIPFRIQDPVLVFILFYSCVQLLICNRCANP